MCTPVATGSMRNWLRAEGIEALRGACEGGSKRCRVMRMHSPPGYFAKRVWKLLILQELTIFGAQKSLQECDGEGFSSAGGSRGRVSRRGNMKNVIITVYRVVKHFFGMSLGSVGARARARI